LKDILPCDDKAVPKSLLIKSVIALDAVVINPTIKSRSFKGEGLGGKPELFKPGNLFGPGGAMSGGTTDAPLVRSAIVKTTFPDLKYNSAPPHLLGKAKI
jgi:hypothetical protein